ncbi:MAG TPA: class I SAM-dependent rRNA methyltransferase [Bacteroidia bacterium]|nr:class I SAM-dependent rRNA methyltransferase [Bacteroidia bacterium]
MAKIILRNDKEHSLLRFHPWVFSGGIKIKDDLLDGELVEVYSAKQQFLGVGHYQNASISVRLISFTPVEINEEFWFNKINKAYQYRLDLGILNENTNVCRLIFGEGDGLPGLIIDYYDGNIVFQAHSIGMHMNRQNILEALQSAFGVNLKSVYDKSSETLPKQYASSIRNEYLLGSVGEKVVVKENNCKFIIDWENGQKTGFFVDQRDNRLLLSKYSKNKAVLNTFSYTGGFSVYAALAGAKLVHSVDSSVPAIELSKQNAALNNITNHEGFSEDVFDFLKDKDNVYDVIVLDPPAFAKSRDVKHNAVKGYIKLNALALKKIKPGGILFTFSCSGVIDKMLFYNSIAAAAIEAKRNVKVVHYLYQPADHPVIPFFPEGEYLKGMVLWVE